LAGGPEWFYGFTCLLCESVQVSTIYPRYEKFIVHKDLIKKQANLARMK